MKRFIHKTQSYWLWEMVPYPVALCMFCQRSLDKTIASQQIAASETSCLGTLTSPPDTAWQPLTPTPFISPVEEELLVWWPPAYHVPHWSSILDGMAKALRHSILSVPTSKTVPMYLSRLLKLDNSVSALSEFPWYCTQGHSNSKVSFTHNTNHGIYI